MKKLKQRETFKKRRRNKMRHSHRMQQGGVINYSQQFTESSDSIIAKYADPNAVIDETTLNNDLNNIISKLSDDRAYLQELIILPIKDYKISRLSISKTNNALYFEVKSDEYLKILDKHLKALVMIYKYITKKSIQNNESIPEERYELFSKTIDETLKMLIKHIYKVYNLQIKISKSNKELTPFLKKVSELFGNDRNNSFAMLKIGDKATNDLPSSINGVRNELITLFNKDKQLIYQLSDGFQLAQKVENGTSTKYIELIETNDDKFEKKMTEKNAKTAKTNQRNAIRIGKTTTTKDIDTYVNLYKKYIEQYTNSKDLGRGDIFLDILDCPNDCDDKDNNFIIEVESYFSVLNLNEEQIEEIIKKIRSDPILKNNVITEVTKIKTDKIITGKGSSDIISSKIDVVIPEQIAAKLEKDFNDLNVFYMQQEYDFKKIKAEIQSLNEHDKLLVISKLKDKINGDSFFNIFDEDNKNNDFLSSNSSLTEISSINQINANPQLKIKFKELLNNNKEKLLTQFLNLDSFKGGGKTELDAFLKWSDQFTNAPSSPASPLATGPVPDQAKQVQSRDSSDASSVASSTTSSGSDLQPILDRLDKLQKPSSPDAETKQEIASLKTLITLVLEKIECENKGDTCKGANVISQDKLEKLTTDSYAQTVGYLKLFKAIIEKRKTTNTEGEGENPSNNGEADAILKKIDEAIKILMSIGNENTQMVKVDSETKAKLEANTSDIIELLFSMLGIGATTGAIVLGGKRKCKRSTKKRMKYRRGRKTKKRYRRKHRS